jgi:hypothetical protein
VAVAHRGRVERQHVRQHHRVQGPVPELPALERAERVADRVDGTEALLQRERPVEGGRHHLAPRVEIGAVGDRALDIGEGPAQAVERDAVGRRVERGREIGLDAVGERVHPRRGGQARRHLERQRRVADGDPGDQKGAAQNERVPGVRPDRRSTDHLGAGAGGGGDRDDRGEGVADAGDAALVSGVLPKRAAVAGA